MSDSDFPYSIRDLVPHAGSMSLLDRVLEVSENHVVAELTIPHDSLFLDSDRKVPVWIGLEFMAQAVAAFSGYWRRQKGLPIDLGFLLGTRHFECRAESFPCGCTLTMRAELEITGLNGLSVFACSIYDPELVASARLNVFLPADSREYLREKGL